MAIHNLSNCLPDCGLPFNSPGTLAVSEYVEAIFQHTSLKLESLGVD